MKMSMSILLSEAEKKLLKGLPLVKSNEISEVQDEDENKAFEDLRDKLLLSSGSDAADDLSLMLAYRLFDNMQNNQISWLDEMNLAESKRFEILLLLTIKLIRLFVQLNSTGPSLHFDEGSLLSQTTVAVFEELDLRTCLEKDGLEISEHVKLPQLLVVAEEFLKLSSEKPEFWISHLFGWWGIRVFFLHQKILDGRSISLAGSIGSIASAIQTQFESYQDDQDLKALWLCELCDIHLYYYDIVSAKACIANARNACGVHFYTTGVLGKKTRYQQSDLAQLVVQAKMMDSEQSKIIDNNTFFFEEFKKSNSLINIPLDDETRLNKLNLNKDAEDACKMKLSTIQQIVLLSELNYVKKSQAKDDLLKQDVLAYTQSLLEEPNLWNILLVTLMQRSMFETDHFRTVERSMMQFENIQKAIKDTSPSFNARYQFYHAACIPLKWEIEIALGDVLFSLGQVKSALDIYLHLNMWEHVIVCYTQLKLRHKAEEVIRKKMLENGETPKLLVYLGDATGDISFYEKAWILSKERNFLSRQRLGVHWFKKQEYENAIPFLQKAVELNPLEQPVWVRLGFAALETENWELAAKSFMHANSLDDESFENWNNLAKAALKMGNKDQALRALKQATKCNYDEWKVWENLLLVAIQCFDVEWAIMAFNRLIDLKGNYADDVTLRILVDLICDNSWDKKGDTSERGKEMMLKLMGRISSKVTTNAEVWQSYSTLLYRIVTTNNEDRKEQNEESMMDKWYKLIQFQQKAVRCRVQDKNWDKIPELTEKAVESVYILCQRTVDFLSNCSSNPSCKDFKTQAEFLHKQVSNTVNRKIKETLDPTKYQELAITLSSSLEYLSNSKAI